MNLRTSIIRWVWFRVFFSGFRWYRRLHGGRWFRVMIDFPVCGPVWCDVPDHAEPGIYREGLWRGTPEVEDHRPTVALTY